MQIVWFFEKPIIGYCKDCDVIAEWDSEEGLRCPKCKSTDISTFEWDEQSRYPE